MSPNYSQTPNAPNVEQLFKRLYPEIPKAVWRACRFHDYQTNKAEIEDISDDVSILLSKNDYKKLHSIKDPSKAENWLYKLVWRHVGRYVHGRRKQKESVSLEELPPDSLACEPVQEKALISEDERKAFRAFVRSLPVGKQRLVVLVLRELNSREIGKEMGIKIKSVY